MHQGENIAALVVNEVSHSLLGVVGGIIAVVGVISASVTSGDTALRSARLIIADFLNMEQKTIWKRLVISVPMFVIIFGMSFVDFNIVWRYFSWTNQTLAVFTLWAATVYLLTQKNTRWGYIITLIPALFMTMVSVSYILIAPEGLNLPEQLRWIGYAVAAAITIILFCMFVHFAHKQSRTVTFP